MAALPRFFIGAELDKAVAEALWQALQTSDEKARERFDDLTWAGQYLILERAYAENPELFLELYERAAWAVQLWFAALVGRTDRALYPDLLRRADFREGDLDIVMEMNDPDALRLYLEGLDIEDYKLVAEIESLLAGPATPPRRGQLRVLVANLQNKASPFGLDKSISDFFALTDSDYLVDLAAGGIPFLHAGLQFLFQGQGLWPYINKPVAWLNFPYYVVLELQAALRVSRASLMAVLPPDLVSYVQRAL